MFNDKDEYLNEFISIKKYYYNKRYNRFTKMYSDIKNKYNSVLNEKENKDRKVDFVKFEKYRLENNKFSIESNTNAFMISLFTLLITIIIAVFVTLNIVDDNIKLIILGSYIVLLLIYSCSIFIDNIKVRIYDLAIKVLDDIEKQNKEKKSACDEVAATRVKNSNQNMILKIISMFKQ